MIRKFIVAAGLALAVFSMASPVSALEGECIWNAVSPQGRVGLVADLRARGEQHPDKHVGKEAKGHWIDRCGVEDDRDMDIAISLLASMAMIEAGAQELHDDYGVDRAKLKLAWEGATPEAVARGSRAVLARDRGEEASMDPVSLLAGAMFMILAVPEQAGPAVINYVHGNVRKEAFESLP